jgi:hypothetical protein
MLARATPLTAVDGEMMERQSIWAGVTGQKLVLEVKAGSEAGLSPDDIIRTLRARAPWNKWSQETLCRQLRTARRFHGDSPPDISSERWMSLLQEWGKTKGCMSREQACDLVNRLLAIPAPWAAHVDQLFIHMEHRRHWRGVQKIEWIKSALDRLTRNPLDWPIPPTQRGRPDVQAGLVLAALRKGLAEKSEIAAETGIKPGSLQTLLESMRRSKEIKSIGLGRYAEFERFDLPTYARPDVDKAILNELANGPATPPELRGRIGCTKGGIVKGLRRLRKAQKIDLVERARSVARGGS